MTDEIKRPQGQQPHIPTEEQRITAREMRACGAPDKYIAERLGICIMTLRKHYHDDLAEGKEYANFKMAQSIFMKGLGDGKNAATCAIFWMKCNAGWHDPESLAKAASTGAAVASALIAKINAREITQEDAAKEYMKLSQQAHGTH